MASKIMRERANLRYAAELTAAFEWFVLDKSLLSDAA